MLCNDNRYDYVRLSLDNPNDLAGKNIFAIMGRTYTLGLTNVNWYLLISCDLNLLCDLK